MADQAQAANDDKTHPTRITTGDVMMGDDNRALIGSQFSGATTISFGDSYLISSTVLLRQRLYLTPSSSIVAPSNADGLIDTLRKQRVIFLYAPAFWRSSYVAEYLAQAVMDKRDQGLYYALASEASAESLLDALRDDNNALKGEVVLASSVLRGKYPGNLLRQIAEQTRQRGAYLILTTEEKREQWSDNLAQLGDTALFADLTAQSPYTTDNLAQWLLNSPEVKTAFEKTPLTTVNQMLPGSSLSLSSVAEQLGSPGAIQQFLNQLNEEIRSPDSKKRSVEQHISDVRDSHDKSVQERIKEWFDHLDEPEKYLVLAISLLDGLPQETFWAIYEQLTQYAWRERNMQLAMSDYHNIAANLNQFVTAIGDRVSFHNPDERRKLVAYALGGYRRSLVQALPVLADIVSGADQPVAHQTGSLSGRLRALDIFGSELEPTGENRLRQERLRNSLANSIAQIAERELTTTQHLLLAWASGVGDEQSDIVNMRLRIAVIITLVQMLTINAPRTVENWYNRHTAFALLGQWYDRYNARRVIAYSQTAHATEERHRNIRGTMALALCHLGRRMAADEFGIAQDETLPIRGFPPRQPDTSELQSPWHMLLALAWDPDSTVRTSILEGIPLLLQRHPQHAETLLNLLATDWRAEVRIRTAELLASMATRDPARAYLVNRFLITTNELVERGVPADPSHYMRREALANQYPFPLHIWTATLTMFLIARRDEATFQAYLDTLPAYEDNNPSWLALADVIRYVLTNPELLDELRDTTLIYLLTHTSPDNAPSRVSQLFAAEIRNYIIHPPIERNTASIRTWLREAATQKPRGLPGRDILALRAELKRMTINERHIFALLDHYIRSNEPLVRRRIQHILYVQQDYVQIR